MSENEARTVTAALERWAGLRRAACYLAVAALVLAAIGVVHYRAESRGQRQTHETSERLNVSLGQTALVRALETVQSDLAYLAQHNQSLGLFRDEPGAKRALTADFMTFAAEKGLYDQVRFLDPRGMELVRVNLEEAGPRPVPADRLQNKADRYYFEEAAALGRGEVYISPLDLNVERGRVQQPLKPVIRLSTPVFGPDRERTGVLILNYLGERLLGAFRTATANISDHVVLLNADGFWLSSPRPEDEWGFMSGQQRSFATDHRSAWERIRRESAGQFTTADGTYTFATVHPIEPRAGTGRPASGPWKVVSQLGPGELGLGAGAFARHHLPLYSVMLVLLAMGAILLARARLRQRQALMRVAFEQRFREILENIDLMGLGLDVDGTINFCNRALLERVGWEARDLYGRSCFQTLIAAEDRAQYDQLFRELVAGERPLAPSDSRILTREGERRIVAWNCAPVQRPDGARAGLVFLGEDVTEAREAEEQVRMLSRAVEQSPATVMITDPRGAIEYVNPKFTQLTGYTLDEVRGINPRILKSGKTTPEEYACLWKTVTSGGEWRGELQNRKKNGDLYWEAATICAVHDRRGEVAHFLAVKEDITERRRLEDRFRHCVESAPCALVLGDRDGRIVLINRGVEKLFGYARDELLGREVELLLPKELRERHVRYRTAFHSAPNARPMGAGRDLMARRKDGSRFPVEVGLIPVEDSDESDLVLASVVDITERRRLERALVERDVTIAESRALAAVGRMANMVAHDIRNPLSSVKMGLQIIGKQLADRLTPEVRELSGIALEQVHYMEEILDDLMSYSRENHLSLEWLQVDKLLDAAVLLVQRQIDEHRVTVRTRYQTGLPHLHGDATRLRRAFSNLILNAAQATRGLQDREPQVLISTHLELAPGRPRIRVEIRDNGPGVDPDQIPRLFEPFFTTRSAGTGLGLPIVRRIVEQHRGTVEIWPGDTGTCVSVVLPTGPLELPAQEAQPERSADLALAAGDFDPDAPAGGSQPP